MCSLHPVRPAVANAEIGTYTSTLKAVTLSLVSAQVFPRFSKSNTALGRGAHELIDYP